MSSYKGHSGSSNIEFLNFSRSRDNFGHLNPDFWSRSADPNESGSRIRNTAFYLYLAKLVPCRLALYIYSLGSMPVGGWGGGGTKRKRWEVPPGSAGVDGPLDDHPDSGARRPRVDHNAGLHLDKGRKAKVDICSSCWKEKKTLKNGNCMRKYMCILTINVPLILKVRDVMVFCPNKKL
jgi:hypothetical protein